MTTVNDFFKPYGITPLSPLEESNAVFEALEVGSGGRIVIRAGEPLVTMRLKIAAALRAQGLDPEWKIAP